MSSDDKEKIVREISEENEDKVQKDSIGLMKCRNCKSFYKDGDGKGFCRSRITGKGLSGDWETHEEVGEGDHCASFDEADILDTKQEAYRLIKGILNKYMDMKEEDTTLIALWILGTYTHDHFQSYPYIFINAMRGSGKTRLLKLVKAMSKNGDMLNSLTEAVLFRSVGTLCIDEFESVARKGRENLRELLNSAYKKGAKVKRLKKKRTFQGEEQVIEEFEVYRPIMLANIWGMEEVLGDRCISIVLEKSSNKAKTKLVENFEKSPEILEIIRLCELWCSLCSVVTLENVYKKWNDYVISKYLATSSTYTTYTPLTTLTTLTTQEEELFKKIDGAEVDGRNLELFLPLFLIGNDISKEVFEEIIGIANNIIKEKKIEESAESRDIIVFDFVSRQEGKGWRRLKELTTLIRAGIDEESEDIWLTSKWLGRALKRLNLIKEKRRMGAGIEVILDPLKAQEKLKMFGFNK